MLTKLKQKVKEKLGVPSQNWSLHKIKENGFSPKVIYDIGAYSGMWTKEMLAIFPEASFYMFEGQESKIGDLQTISNQHPLKVNFHIGLLGAEDEKIVVFNEYETASSVLSEHFDTGANKREAKLKRLDTVRNENNIPTADFIKLDTQGYELEILKGGMECLKNASVVMMEVSFIDIYKNAPLAYDVISFMNSQDYQLYDICSLMRRPVDQALFQADMIFVQKNSMLLKNKKW